MIFYCFWTKDTRYFWAIFSYSVNLLNFFKRFILLIFLSKNKNVNFMGKLVDTAVIYSPSLF